MMIRTFISVLIVISTLGVCDARDAAIRKEFVRQNPCPATGEQRGACPGYVVDHIEPLCAGGADSTENMQWQAVDEAKAKDKEEWRQCRELRRSQP